VKRFYRGLKRRVRTSEPRHAVAHALACRGGIHAAIFPDVEMNLAAAR